MRCEIMYYFVQKADLRTEIYNSYFNSSEYTLIKNKYQPIPLTGERLS